MLIYLLQLDKMRTLLAVFILAAILLIPAVSYAGDETAVDTQAESSSSDTASGSSESEDSAYAETTTIGSSSSSSTTASGGTMNTEGASASTPSTDIPGESEVTADNSNNDLDSTSANENEDSPDSATQSSSSDEQPADSNINNTDELVCDPEQDSQDTNPQGSGSEEQVASENEEVDIKESDPAADDVVTDHNTSDKEGLFQDTDIENQDSNFETEDSDTEEVHAVAIVEEEEATSEPSSSNSIADTKDSQDGNSYKAEIEVANGPPHMEPDENANVKVTFTELGEVTPLGSARVYLDTVFNYTDYSDGNSVGLSVNSSYGDDGDSRWNAVWQTVDTQQTILLTADYTDASNNGYLTKDEWVSVLFNAQAPSSEGEHEFETAAWTDHGSTTINNMHPDYRDPTIVVSDEVSYRIIENINTGAELKQILEDGSRTNVPDPMPHPDEDLLDLEIEYQFDLQVGHQYTEGAFYEFALPDEFAVYNEVTGDLVDGESNIFGQYLLTTNGTVRLTFNDQISAYEASGLQGWVNFQTEVREDLDGDLRREIEINIRDNTLVKIPLNFEAKAGSSIDKSGVPNRGETANQTYNADSITWEVDFNKDLQTIGSAVLSDPLGENLELENDSIELYFLRVQLDGSVIQEAAVADNDYEIVTSADDPEVEGFEIRFNSEISDAYRLVFSTDIDEDGFTYTNTAELSGSNIEPLLAASTVDVDRGAVIEKEASDYDQNVQLVDWETRINYNLKVIPAADSTVTDTYGPEQALVAGSLTVSLVTLDDDGVETGATLVDSDSYTFNEVKDIDDNIVGFEITFNDNINSAYKINYQTEPVDRVYGTVTLDNTAEFSGESDGASQTLDQSILSKTHQKVNYSDKTVEWEIVINRDQHEMNNLEITDTFTNGGLTITPGDPSNQEDLRSAVAVSGLPAGVDYDIELIPLIDGDGFIINNFHDGSGNPVTIAETITVAYTTIFAYEDLTNPADNFINNVRLDWLDVDNEPRNLNVTEVFSPNDETRQNGYKGGSYNATTKKITWTIGVNYNLREIDSVQVFDYILGNQTLVDDSITVYNATIEQNGEVNRGADPLTVGTDYQLDLSVTGPDSEDNPGFRITLGDIDALYIIEYQTSLDDRIIAGQYDNTAYLYSNDELQTELDATVSNQNWGIYTSKQGSNEGRTVTWQIDINPGLSQLTNVVIEDSLSPGQRIDQDSIKVYTTTITGEDGSYGRDAELTRDTDYAVTFSGDLNDGENMVLSFIGVYSTIDTAYIVEYQTFIEFVFQGEVSNSAVLTATTEELPDDTGDSEDIGGRITSGEGGISGFLGRLVVRKTDVSTGSLLPGAEFELRHESGDTVIATATSGANGTAVFNSILFGNYRVTEVQPPSGYDIDDRDPREVTINSSSTTVTFSNTQLTDENGNGDNDDPGDNGDNGSSVGGDPGSGFVNGTGNPHFWQTLSSGIQSSHPGKTPDSETQLSGSVRELPRTGGGIGILQIFFLSGLVITAGLFAFIKGLRTNEK